MSRMLGVVALLAGAAASLVFVAGGLSSTRAAHRARGGAFAWLHPGPAPVSWRQIRLASGAATLSVPPRWVDLTGDKGTATVAPPGPAGYLSGYLNITPGQGPERPHGFARFRVGHLTEEGSRNVRIVSAAEGLRMRGGRGSCVID